VGTDSYQATCSSGELMPRKRASEWHDAVSHRAKSVVAIGEQGWVQPGGQPISISANRGFKTRLDGDPSGVVVPGWWVDTIVCRLSPPVPCDPVPVPLLVFGVAHNAACTFSGWLFRSNCDGPAVFFPSCTVGVDHNRACIFRNGTRRPSWPVELPKSVALGVCHSEAEPSLALVRGARFLRAEYVPFTIEPEDDQRTKDRIEESSPVSGNDSWNVLEKDKARLNVGNDSEDVSPDEPVVVHAESPAGETDGLAWESRTDEIHRSTPRSAIEGANVIPDWSKVKGIVFHAGSEDRCREGGVFDIADGSDIGGESQSQVESADTGAQADGT
jgi:hypothetical protein